MTIASIGTLDLNGFNQTIAGIANAGLISMGLGTGRARPDDADYSGSGGRSR